MANIIFKRGLKSNLPTSNFVDGALYLTMDEGALYAGVPTGEGGAVELKRLGDFITVANVASLPASAHTYAMYYCEAENVLARYNGTSWVQINKQPTAEEMKTLLGLGSAAYTAADAYDAAGAAAAVLGEASDTADKNTVYGAKAAAAAAQTQADKGVADAAAAKAAADAAQTQADKGVADAAAAKAAADAAKSAADAAQAAADAAQADADTNAAAIEVLKAAVGEGGTVDEKIKAAVGALDVEDAAVAGEYVSSVSEADGKISVTRAKLPVYGMTKAVDAGEFAAVYHLTVDGTEVGTAINIPKDMVVRSGSVVTDPEGQPAGTYLKIEFQNQNTPVYIDVASLIEYVTAGDDTATVHVTVSDDHKVTANIIAGSVGATELNAEVNGKLNQAHTHGNAAVLDGITAEDVAAWDKAVDDAAQGIADAAAAKAAADAVLGTAADTADKNTVYGAKAAAAAAQTQADKGVADAAAAKGAADAAQAAADAAQGDVDGLKAYVGTFTAVGSETTVVGYVDAKVAAATTAAMTWGEF